VALLATKARIASQPPEAKAALQMHSKAKKRIVFRMRDPSRAGGFTFIDDRIRSAIWVGKNGEGVTKRGRHEGARRARSSIGQNNYTASVVARVRLKWLDLQPKLAGEAESA
jgi:hypothetical protein